jgi:hypothetical protein
MVHEAITLESAYSAVAATLAVAVESTARTVAVQGIVHRPFAPPQAALELSLAWPHGPISTTSRAFLMITAELAALLELQSGAAHLTSSAAARSIDSPDAIGTLIFSGDRQARQPADAGYPRATAAVQRPRTRAGQQAALLVGADLSAVEVVVAHLAVDNGGRGRRRTGAARPGSPQSPAWPPPASWSGARPTGR